MSLWGNNHRPDGPEEPVINIFITYRCNLACPYCFASTMQDDFPQDMSEASFARLIRWIKTADIKSVALLGGEPTLHGKIVAMVQELAAADVTVALFTNALFPPELANVLSRYVKNFIINANDPSQYGRELELRYHKNLTQLTREKATIIFSKNFATKNQNYSDLLKLAKQYGANFIRYDLARPDTYAKNQYCKPAATSKLMETIASFVRDCDQEGIKTGMDCCVKYCDLSFENRQFLERVSFKMRGICHPSIDIHPNLSASYCLPMSDIRVEDVTSFTNVERLTHHFASAVRSFRFENVEEDCLHCHDFRRKCQGGCMAIKRKPPVPPLYSGKTNNSKEI